MAKNHQSDNPLFKALVKKYEAEIASAFATLIVYFDSSVGIRIHLCSYDAKNTAWRIELIGGLTREKLIVTTRRSSGHLVGTTLFLLFLLQTSLAR